MAVEADDGLADWQIIARETNNPAGTVISFLLRLLFLMPEAPAPSSVTWTVRHRQTGALGKITAASEDEFKQRLAANAFDPPA